MFKKILLAVDGSEHGNKAAEAAGNMVRAFNSDLWVVIAYEPIPAYIDEPRLHEEVDERIRGAERIFAAARDLIGEVPGEINKEILEGPPAEAILAVAEARSVDLIVMGTRGLGRLASIVVGSQSQKVVANSCCPVLLVR